MSRTALWTALISLAALPALAAPAPALPTPAQIQASVAKSGPKAAIASLTKANQWDGVAAQMAAGDSAWVALAPKLAPGADAGTAEDLGLSLATALPINPAAVLAAIDPANGPALGAGRVCSAPFIEDPPEHHKAYLKSALAKAGAVADPALAANRTACLAVLKSTH